MQALWAEETFLKNIKIFNFTGALKTQVIFHVVLVSFDIRIQDKWLLWSGSCHIYITLSHLADAFSQSDLQMRTMLMILKHTVQTV